MRKIHFYINEIPEKDDSYSFRSEVTTIFLELEESVRNELYPDVKRPFRPFQMVNKPENADIAILLLPDLDTPRLKQTYYQLFSQSTPLFIITESGSTGDKSFRDMLYKRHPHLVVEPQFDNSLKLKEYLSDFFLRELRKKFVARHSQVDPESLIQSYQRDWQCFHPPPDYEKILELLEKHHFVILYGPSNSGKSCLARNLMKYYHERNYRLNEVLTPNVTPHLFLNVLKSPTPVVTLFDNDAYSYEWEWQLSHGLLTLFLASIEKWVDRHHPVIFVLSGKKNVKMIEDLLKYGWQTIKEKIFSVSSFELNRQKVDKIVDKHLDYYNVPEVHHSEIKRFFQDIYEADITPSLIFYSLRFAILPHGPASLEKLKHQKKHNLYNPRRLFLMYLNTASMKDMLFLYLLLATEMELDRTMFETLLQDIFHFSLFMEGNIVDFTPPKQQWIEQVFNDLNGAVFRNFSSDKEERLVFTHRLFRSTVSRFFKQHSPEQQHQTVGEAIVDFLMNRHTLQGNYFALRFLLFHFRAFSTKFRKKIFYQLGRDDNHAYQSNVVALLYQVFFLLGKNGQSLLDFLIHNSDHVTREENARAFGIFFDQTRKHKNGFFKTFSSDRSITVTKAFAESAALGYLQLIPVKRKIFINFLKEAPEEVQTGALFGLLLNEFFLEKDEQKLLNNLLEKQTAGIEEAICLAFTHMPASLLASSYCVKLADLLKNENGFIRSQIVGSVGCRLSSFPQKIIDTIFKLSDDPSPLVLKEVAIILIKNYTYKPNKIFNTLLTMVQSPQPSHRATVSSVIVEHFAVFSSKQQTRFLLFFLQSETIEGIKTSISELIGSHFHLVKPQTQNLYFQNVMLDDSEIRANIAEQILTYYDQLNQNNRDRLSQLVQDEKEIVRLKIVNLLPKFCQKLPNNVIRLFFDNLAKDRSEFIRSRLALQVFEFASCITNKQLETTVERFSKDTELVRSNLAKSLLLNQKEAANKYRIVLNNLEHDLSKQVRLAILRQIVTSRDHIPEKDIARILEKYSQDSSHEIRFETVQAIVDLAPELSDKTRQKILPLLTGLEGETGVMLNRELEMAAEIQNNLLPKRLPRLDGYGFSFLFAPARIIGGDFIGFFPLDDERLGIAMADISGKGIPAALLMANFHALLKAQIAVDPEPIGLTGRLNRMFKESTLGNKFVSFVYGILDRSAATFTYVNAGHNYPILFMKPDTINRLETGGSVLGVFADEQYLSETVSLTPSSKLIIFTDGVTESRDNDDNEFGEERLIDYIKTNSHLLPKQLVDGIEHELHLFSNVLVPHDDISLIVIQRLEETS